MRNLVIPGTAELTSKKGRRILGQYDNNITRSFHLLERNEINHYENPETGGLLGGQDTRLDENPWMFENLRSSESLHGPDDSNIEINDDVSSVHNHPICVDCVTPMNQGLEGDNNEDDVIIDLEMSNLDENLGNMEDFDLFRSD